MGGWANGQLTRENRSGWGERAGDGAVGMGEQRSVGQAFVVGEGGVTAVMWHVLMGKDEGCLD